MKISHFPVRFSRRMITVTAAAGAATVLGVTATVAVASGAPARAHGFSFRLVPSAGISSCLPHARGNVTITPQGENDKMVVHVAGLPKNSEFDLFVIQVPDKPFGVAWYQGDLETNEAGKAHGKFIGRFSIETFAIAQDSGPAPVVHDDGPFPDAASNPPFGPIHTYHLGLWFNSPKDAQAAGCGAGVTPFNGDHHAGVQVLSTKQFENDQGPLRRLQP